MSDTSVAELRPIRSSDHGALGIDESIFPSKRALTSGQMLDGCSQRVHEIVSSRTCYDWSRRVTAGFGSPTNLPLGMLRSTRNLRDEKAMLKEDR